MNQQILVNDHFNHPAIFNRGIASKTLVQTYGSQSIEYKYNSTGYRTHEFIKTTTPYGVAFGSSHTEGIGLADKDRWTTHLEKLTGYPVFAVAAGGTSSKIILKNLSNWLLSDMPTPEIIILQWPPIYRLFFWKDSKRVDITASSAQTPFNELLKLGEENFWVEYADNIILADQLCKHIGVKHLHIFLDSEEYTANQVNGVIKQAGVNLLLDEKLPGKTWLFDCNALDKIHHSSYCHQQWAERIYVALR